MSLTTKKEYSVGELAEMVNGQTNGRHDTIITGISGIREAEEGDITFLENKRYLPLAKDSKASALIIGNNIKIDEEEISAAIISVENPGVAFTKVAEAFAEPPIEFEPGVHPTAVIGEDVSLGAGVVVQAYAVIADGAVIGDNTIIYPGVYIGHYTRIGADCIMYPGVKIRERIVIGDRVIIHSGAVIGSDGFGFATVKGEHHKIPQIGTVEIEDDVEIGANVTIDRARFDKTHVGKGTKIDNAVMLAHNVWVGERCLLIGQSGIAGSSRLGNNCVLAAAAGLGGHVSVGDNTIIGGKSGVTKDVPANKVFSGFPAQEHDKQRREHIYIRRLPELTNRVKELEERLAQLEKAAENR